MPKPKSKTTGWKPSRTRTRRIEALAEQWPQLAPDDGGETLWAEIRDNLTFDEIDAIPLGAGTKWGETWAAIAAHVLDWNVMGQVDGTDEWDVLPPPATEGPDVFQHTAKGVTVWLATELKFGPLRMTPALKPDATTSESTDVG